MEQSYEDALEQAKINLADLKERGEDAIGGTWEELRNELWTPEEIAASNLRVALIGELIKARQEKGIDKEKLVELSGVKKPIISRMEKGSTTPQLESFLKVLAPLGKTLAVVPIEKN